MAVLPGGQKIGRIAKVATRQGFTVVVEIILNLFLFCRLILSMVLHNLWGETLNHQKVIIQQWTGKENWKKKTSSC